MADDKRRQLVVISTLMANTHVKLNMFYVVDPNQKPADQDPHCITPTL